MKYDDNGNQLNYYARLYFYKNGNEYGHIYIDFYVKPYSDNGEKMFGWHDLKNFKITSQFDRESLQRSDDYMSIYGWDFENGSTNLNTYKDIAKIYKEVENKYQKLTDENGRPLNFAEYAFYICKALGIKNFSLNDTEYKLNELKSTINQIKNNFKNDWNYR